MHSYNNVCILVSGVYILVSGSDRSKARQMLILSKSSTFYILECQFYLTEAQTIRPKTGRLATIRK